MAQPMLHCGYPFYHRTARSNERDGEISAHDLSVLRNIF